MNYDTGPDNGDSPIRGREIWMKAGADNPLVAHLAAAHHTGHLVPYASALVPHDIVAAYATQAHVAETLAADVSGWKVGREGSAGCQSHRPRRAPTPTSSRAASAGTQARR